VQCLSKSYKASLLCSLSEIGDQCRLLTPWALTTCIITLITKLSRNACSMHPILHTATGCDPQLTATNLMPCLWHSLADPNSHTFSDWGPMSGWPVANSTNRSCDLASIPRQLESCVLQVCHPEKGRFLETGNGREKSLVMLLCWQSYAPKEACYPPRLHSKREQSCLHPEQPGLHKNLYAVGTLRSSSNQVKPMLGWFHGSWGDILGVDVSIFEVSAKIQLLKYLLDILEGWMGHYALQYQRN
jgi:hypothetical protein